MRSTQETFSRPDVFSKPRRAEVLIRALKGEELIIGGTPDELQRRNLRLAEAHLPSDAIGAGTKISSRGGRTFSIAADSRTIPHEGKSFTSPGTLKYYIETASGITVKDPYK